jgi:hypothetical protein
MALLWPRNAGGALVSGVLAAAGIVVLLVAMSHQHPAPPSAAGAVRLPAAASAPDAVQVPVPGSARARPRGQTPDLRDPLRGPVLPDSVPTRLVIPRLGVRTTLERLGLTHGAVLEAPGDPDVAGWYTGAPTPGALGPAVVAGHVTWNRRPAVFFRLAELRPGDRVAVRRDDHRTAVFVVRRVQGFAKDRFPTDAVYGPLDHAGLRLVTCGGPYDADRGRFAHNVVVFADLVAVRRS